jgi:hypothetical protein
LFLDIEPMNTLIGQTFQQSSAQHNGLEIAALFSVHPRRAAAEQLLASEDEGAVSRDRKCCNLENAHIVYPRSREAG